MQAFIIIEQIDWAKFRLTREYAYKNNKNISINHILFKLNCKYYFYNFYKKIYFYFNLKSAKKLLVQLQAL